MGDHIERLRSLPSKICDSGLFGSRLTSAPRRVLRFRSFERPAGGGNTQRKSQQPERERGAAHQSERDGQGSSSIKGMVVRTRTPARDMKRSSTAAQRWRQRRQNHQLGGPTATESVSLSC